MTQWMTYGSTNLPHLTKPQALLLTLWSCGIACTGCADGAPLRPCYAAAAGEDRYARTTPLARCLDAFDAAGRQRAALDVTTGFVPLLRWIVRVWHGDQYVTRPASPWHSQAVEALTAEIDQGAPIIISPQILREHLAAVTCPAPDDSATPLADALFNVAAFRST